MGTFTTTEPYPEKYVPALLTDTWKLFQTGAKTQHMEPNNQYLCIVPDRASTQKHSDQFFLPFEGDRTLSVVLSKAFLLADDSNIKDKSIVSQIKAR